MEGDVVHPPSGAPAGRLAIRVPANGGGPSLRLHEHDLPRVCWTDGAFITALRDPRTTGIVWDTSTHLRDQQVFDAIKKAAPAIPIMLRANLAKPDVAPLIIDLANVAGALTVGLIGDDGYAATYADWLARPGLPKADHHILRRIGRSQVDSTIQAPLIAIALAKRRTRVPDIARACGWSVRKLQLRLHAAGVPNGRTFLGWAMALHTTWRLQVEGCSVKQAAAEAGFPDSAQLSNYLGRHVGRRPKAAIINGGFWRQLDEFDRILRDPTLR